MWTRERVGRMRRASMALGVVLAAGAFAGTARAGDDPPAAQILLTKAQMQAVFLVTVVLLPLSMAALGGLVWWRRR